VQPQWLRRIVAGQAAAARLGRAYLDKHPQQRDCTRLMTSIESALQEQGASFSAGANAEQTAAVLQQLVRDEYARGEVTSVAGWEVSVTEARLYALVSMTD